MKLIYLTCEIVAVIVLQQLNTRHHVWPNWTISISGTLNDTCMGQSTYEGISFSCGCWAAAVFGPPLIKPTQKDPLSPRSCGLFFCFHLRGRQRHQCSPPSPSPPPTFNSLISSQTTSPQSLALKQSDKHAIIFSLRKLRPLLKWKMKCLSLREAHTAQGHGLMCIFDELGILLCIIRTAEDYVFANKLSDASDSDLFFFFSISLFSAKHCLVRLVLNKPHLVDARGLFVFVSWSPS